MSDALRVSLLGAGSLGGAVLSQLERGSVRGCVPETVIRSTSPGPAQATELLGSTDVLVEAAGVDTARAWLVPAVESGVDVVLCSCAVLADPEFEQVLQASRGAGRVIIPSGAIGGLDLFAAAARACDGSEIEILLTTTKTPKALGVSVGSGETVFDGTARQAGLAFPKTANVAVALGLATTGLDRVRVKVQSDATITRTQHRISLRSPMGDYELVVANSVAPDSGGRTSAITGWSVITVLESLASGFGGGLLVRNHP